MVGFCSVGCKVATDPPDPATSPQARAEPAPLANLTATPGASAGPLATLDSGPVPETLRGEIALTPDAPRESATRDPSRDAKELAGYAVQGLFRTGEGPPGPKGPDVNTLGVEAARRKMEIRVGIEMSQSRARFTFSGGVVLPQGTELRSRADRYGHLLFLPDEDTYRVVEPGALRALLGERRLDVAPLSPSEVVPAGDGTRHQGMRTRRVEVTTRAARASFELATLRDSGEGGVLVCRMLLDLMSALPSTPACATDEMPLHAELRWKTRGGLLFEVSSIVRRPGFPAQDLAVPPSAATFVRTPLPLPPADTMVSRSDLASFRFVPGEVSPAVGRAPANPSPDSGLVLVNSTDQLRVAWLDGVPIAWVAPGGQESLPSLLRGRYSLQWRTFLGDAWEAPETISIPGTSVVGGADSGMR